AEHSINVARLLPKMLQKEGLMHDAAEAYTTDLPTPIKDLVPEFKGIENVFLKKLGIKLQLDLCNSHPLVKRADYLMLRKEAMMNTDIPQEVIDTFTSSFCSPKTADAILEEAGILIYRLKPADAEEMFKEEFKRIFPDYIPSKDDF
ncbi:MAG TPA: hypothetical protein VFM18_15365, partial [Methanosarcina sp.]|nr:hypothetical protein [Methanosarcina sp.]